MQDFTRLKVWQKAQRLGIDVFLSTQRMPRAHAATVAQLRRSVASISANIAEGANKGSNAEFRRFLLIAMGSAGETLSHLDFARHTGALSANRYDDFAARTVEVRKMLSGLIRRVGETTVVQ